MVSEASDSDQYVYTLRDGDTQLEAHPLTAFATEAEFQKLIAMDPAVIPGHLVDPEQPRRWVLVRREAPVDDGQEGARWSIDHLLLDQDGVPTIVEVKRAENTELRRKVIGQIIEYAAALSVNWTIEHVREAFAAEHGNRPGGPDGHLREALGDPDLDIEAYWASVSQNLSTPRLRLLVVADEVPATLRRNVEFLNRAFSEVEILALEVRQFRKGSLRTFVPTVFGHLESKSSTQGRRGVRWNEERFREHARENLSSAALDAASVLLDWSKQHADEIYWGTGTTRGSFTPWVSGPSGRQALFSVYSLGAFEVTAMWWKAPPFSDPQARKRVVDALRQAGLAELPSDGHLRRPSVRLEQLAETDVRARVLDVFAEMIRRVKAFDRPTAILGESTPKA